MRWPSKEASTIDLAVARLLLSTTAISLAGHKAGCYFYGMKTSNIGLALIAIAWSAACGGSNDAGDSTDPTDPLPNIELDCAPEINEPGRFGPDCQIVGSDDVIAQCDHVSEPGSAGTIRIVVHKPERIVIGTPAFIGGNDPVVSIDVASYSVRQGALVQTVEGTQEGAIVFSHFEPGRSLRGHFAAVGFRTNPPPTIACHLADAAFVASAAVR